MSSLKPYLGRCLPLWQFTLSYTHFRLLYSSSVRGEVGGTDCEKFGRLATLSQETEERFPVGQELKKSKKDRLFPKLENPTVTGIKVESEKNVSNTRKEAVLEKWNKFKCTRGRETLNHSVVQDDNEDDFHILIEKGRKNSYTYSRRNHIQETGELQSNLLSHNTNEVTSHTPYAPPCSGELHSRSQSLCTEVNSGVSTQSTSFRPPDKFGTISHVRVDFEDVKGDDGDKAAETFEEGQLTRKHSPVYYGNRMKKLCKERKLNEALHILEVEMPEVGAKPSDYCYNVLISACGKVGYTKKAFQLYNQLKKRGLKVQNVVYTGLFNACANSPWPTTDGLRRATQLRSQLTEKGYLINQTSSHAMIKAFGRCGDIKTAFQVVDDMASSGLLVTTETLNFLFQACITDTVSGFRHAIMVWRKMRELKLQPDIYSYNLLIRCTAECKAGESTFTTDLLRAPPLQEHQHSLKNKRISKKTSNIKKVLLVEAKQELEADNYKSTDRGQRDSTQEASVNESHSVSHVSKDNNHPDEILYPEAEVEMEAKGSEGTSVMLPSILGQTVTPGAVVALNSLEQAQDRLALLGGPVGLLEQMIADGVKPDLKTVTQMVDSLPSDMQTEEALLSSMKNIGLEPDTQFCNMLIRKCSMRGDTQAAKNVLEVIQDYHLVPDIITFGCLAVGCHHLSDATQLLDDMERAHFRPNLEIMAILTRNGLMKGNYFFVLEMLRGMNKRDIKPDEKLLAVLEEGRTRARSLLLKQEGKKIRGQKKKHIEGARIFLLEYKMWLKSSGVQLTDHPWAQYQQQRQAGVDDQQNVELVKIQYWRWHAFAGSRQQNGISCFTYHWLHSPSNRLGSNGERVLSRPWSNTPSRIARCQ